MTVLRCAQCIHFHPPRPKSPVPPGTLLRIRGQTQSPPGRHSILLTTTALWSAFQTWNTIRPRFARRRAASYPLSLFSFGSFGRVDLTPHLNPLQRRGLKKGSNFIFKPLSFGEGLW